MTQPEVTIAQGTLRGTIAKDLNGGNFYKFRGIPYAKPPLGPLRFKAPEDPEKWDGIWDATKEREGSYCRDFFKNNQIIGSEDCLYLNVFTKNISSGKDTKLNPVLVWIHGGGFVFGSGSEEFYGPEFLLTQDVVLVTLNYRVGLLGFISFDDPSLDISGNAGLKDQVMALKWVKNNVNKFGGDPNNVTIFGESAGGSSVHLLTMSPMAKGLFHKAIAQSGAVFNPWVLASGGIKPIAEVLKLESNDEKTIYNVLMKLSAEEILKIQDSISDNLAAGLHRPYSVVVEKNSKQPFLSEEPIKILLSGNYTQVPYMLGYTTSEGMFIELTESKKEQFQTPNMENYVHWYFGYEKDSPESKAVAQKIKSFYFGDGKIEDQIEKIYDLVSDSQIVFGVNLAAKIMFKTSKSPLYLYRMAMETQLNVLKNLLQIKSPGVAHFDDVGYLFKTAFTPEIKPGSEEEICLNKMIKLWTNFAKFGNPTPGNPDLSLKATWKPVSSSNLNFLEIGKEFSSLEKPFLERMRFWEDLFLQSPEGKKLGLKL